MGRRVRDLPRHAFRRIAGGFPLRFLFEVVIEDGSVVFEVVVRDGKSAGSADLMDVNDDDAASARNTLHLMLFDKIIESRSAIRWSLVGVQHDGHSVVAWLVDVGDGLVAATCQLMVPEGFAIQDAKVFAAFGRDVHVSLARKRRCADEEHLLVQDPLYEGLLVC